MALHKLEDYYPNYKQEWGDSELKDLDSYDVYTESNNQVGSIKDLLVDDSGRFRYAVVDTGPWIFGKNVLLPIGLAHFDYQKHRVYVDGLSRNQIENLPEYKREQIVDDQYEEQVRQQYRPLARHRVNQQFMEQPVESDRSVESTQPVEETGDRRVTYEHEPALYGMSEEYNQRPLKLYEEQLITHRHRDKVGEVRVGKHVETGTAEIVEPVDKERVVIERHDVQGEPMAGPEHQFKDEEVARMDVYEERVDVEKRPVVKESVTVRKETEHDTVRAKEQVRHEELDVDSKGEPNVRRKPNS